MNLQTLLDLIGNTPIKAADLTLPSGYTYDRNLQKYRDVKRGVFVSAKQIYSLLDNNEQATEKILRGLAFALNREDLEQPEWFLASQQQLRRLYVQNAALAAGGFNEINNAAFIRLDRALREDLERLVKFGEEIFAGNLTVLQINQRVKMYVGSARVQFWLNRPIPKHRSDEIVIERRELGAQENNCSWCVYLADLGWQVWGMLPAPGESSAQWQDDQCLTNCRCSKRSKVIKKRRLEIMVKKQIDADYRSQKALASSGEDA